MAFNVVEIIDGDTIRVSPKWTWNGREGDTVKILGYTTPVETRQAIAIERLNNLLKNKHVELRNAQNFVSPQSSAIACRVYLNGVDVSKYFPEFYNF